MLAKFTVLFGAVALATAQTWTSTPFNPHSIPLAVRSPYLSTWLPNGNGTALNQAWAQFWAGIDPTTGGGNTGWAGYIRVDGTVYTWLGAPSVSGTTVTPASQTDMEFTASSSFFNLAAGPVDITATFLSPVLPTDLKRHSMPFSYLSISVVPTDGKAHSVQIYTDISAEWATGDPSQGVTWSTATGSLITHSVSLAQQTSFAEANQQSNSGTAVYSIFNQTGLTYQTGADVDVRGAFISNGKLANSLDTSFRAANDNWPVFAFSVDLGSVNCQTEPIVLGVGHYRDPGFEYIQADGTIAPLHPYFLGEFSSGADALSFFMNDFDTATELASKFDDQVKTDAGKYGDDYVGIVELSMRQAFGGMELSIPATGSTDGAMYWLKEISSDGNMQTVDVVFPAWPVLLYGNVDLCKMLLEPLFAYQQSGQYPNKWAVHDMGGNYPKGLGHNDGKDEAMQVEESGNMILMEYSYVMKTGDTTQASKYYDLLAQWTDFLVSDSLIPGDQLSTDDFQGKLANQTNLAIKGILGIQSMAEIATALGKTSDAQNYSSIAASYVTQFMTLATASTGDHITLAYGQDSSWGSAYNLLMDKMLGLNIFPESLYTMQTAWYKSHLSNYGLQLDTRNLRSKSDWEMWTAAAMGDDDLTTSLTGLLKKFISDGMATQPFADLYAADVGTAEGFRARPVAGGHLALIALDAQKAPVGGSSSTTAAPTTTPAATVAPATTAPATTETTSTSTKSTSTSSSTSTKSSSTSASTTATSSTASPTKSCNANKKKRSPDAKVQTPGKRRL